MNRNKTNTIRLTESELKEFIKESVNTILNEISTDLAYRAADLADQQGRFNQSVKFGAYGNRRLANEIGSTDFLGKVHASRQQIKYVNWNDRNIVLYANGAFTVDGRDGENNIKDWVDQGGSAIYVLRVDDKRIARVIAKWCAKYVGESLPEASDWHFWARL